jgi:hypothetical protein
MPDIELLVIDAIRHYIPGVNVFLSPPTDWADLMPFISVKWTGGSPTRWPERIQVSDVEVKVFATERREGSGLFHKVEQAYETACMDRFTNRGLPGVEVPGILTYVRYVSPAGLQYEGLTSKHSDSCLYSGIFRTTSAPTLPRKELA